MFVHSYETAKACFPCQSHSLSNECLMMISLSFRFVFPQVTFDIETVAKPPTSFLSF